MYLNRHCGMMVQYLIGCILPNGCWGMSIALIIMGTPIYIDPWLCGRILPLGCGIYILLQCWDIYCPKLMKWRILPYALCGGIYCFMWWHILLYAWCSGIYCALCLMWWHILPLHVWGVYCSIVCIGGVYCPIVEGVYCPMVCIGGSPSGRLNIFQENIW